MSSTTTSVRRRKGSQHDKTGCLTCRYRRKKCNQNTFPVCGTCARLNLECVREPVRKIVPPELLIGGQAQTQILAQTQAVAPPRSEASWSSSPPTTPLFLLSQPSLLAKPAEAVVESETIASHHRYAMRYYVNELANHFSVSPQFNSFLSEFLPMAMQSQALQESLLSLASSHISLSDPTYAEASLESRAKAIGHLKSAIDRPQRDATWSQEHSATCLVFAMGLITTSDSSGWYSHMQGAKHFMLSARGTSSTGALITGTDCLRQTPEGRWVLRNFAYHDVLGCVTLRSRPLLEPSYISDICDEVDSYMGVGTGLLQYIAEIQILAVELQEQRLDKESSRFSADFEHKWTSMEKELQDWSCPPMTKACDSLKSIAFAYRSVALIMLYRLVRRQAITCTSVYPDVSAQTGAEDDFEAGLIFTTATLVELLQSKISFQVSETVRHISAIPVWSAPEAAILFPLFIAGVEAHDEAVKEEIQTRLGHNLARRKFQNIRRAMDLLKTVWERRSSDTGLDNGAIDWEDVLVEMDWELVLT